jgi:hypothetical protein
MLKHGKLQGDARQETIRTFRAMQAKTSEAPTSVDVGCWNKGGCRAMQGRRLLELLELCKPEPHDKGRCKQRGKNVTRHRILGQCPSRKLGVKLSLFRVLCEIWVLSPVGPYVIFGTVFEVTSCKWAKHGLSVLCLPDFTHNFNIKKKSTWSLNTKLNFQLLKKII